MSIPRVARIALDHSSQQTIAFTVIEVLLFVAFGLLITFGARRTVERWDADHGVP